MNKRSFDKEFKKLRKIFIGFFSLLISLLLFLILFKFGFFEKRIGYIDIAESPSDIYYENYDVSTLNNSKKNLEIKYGYEIFIKTPNHIGPNSENIDNVYSGNRLSCNNCHLLGGTKAFSGPLIGIINRFPQYRGRENKMGTIKERINGCMERSMNGRVLPVEGREINALISYLKWLSRFSPADGNIEGQGYSNIDIPNRAVDLARGEATFSTICSVCHGVDGKGLYNEKLGIYTYPPLWGEDSFNNGAGMTRVITAAQFIKSNMPYGTTYLNPFLTDEDAYDVAGFINQQQRPTKKNLELDFPDLLKKPVSSPYPPFLDSFSIEQHQLGPFTPIIEYYREHYNIKKTK